MILKINFFNIFLSKNNNLRRKDNHTNKQLFRTGIDKIIWNWTSLAEQMTKEKDS